MPSSERIILRKPGRCRRRSPLKQEKLFRHIVEQIISGHLQPGQRLPNRNEYAAQFQVTSVTVQRAFDQLISDRFVTVLHNRGTFVSEKSPHRHRFVIPFAERPEMEHWSRFWHGLVNAAHWLRQNRGWWIDCLFGVSTINPGPEISVLSRDARLGRMAGIFFPNIPYLVENTPLLQEPGIPRAAVMSSRHGAPSRRFGDIITVQNLSESFYRRALERLAALGRHRPAIISLPTRREEVQQTFRKNTAALGMTHVPAWVQSAPQNETDWAENVMHLLFRGPPQDTPDSLIIADDNLSESVCRGLATADIRVPERVSVVTHCNYPVAVPTASPFIRLGYDLIGTLEAALTRLSDWRTQGVFSPEPLEIHPLFSEELPCGHPSESPLVARSSPPAETVPA